jgi:hypothetical protein
VGRLGRGVGLGGRVADGRPGALKPAQAGASDTKRARLIFVGAHDRQDAGCHGGVSGIGRPVFRFQIVIVDLEK